MNRLLPLAFLFFIGSVAGWVLELFFRRFFSSANPERKWINPGFCTGPYVPLYGFGLCLLYLIARLDGRLLPQDSAWNTVILLVMMGVGMTLIEYLAGILSLKVMHVRLWDYSDEWGNLGGIICPKFSLAWALLGAAYYFLVDPFLLGALDWLSNNLAFSFFIGLFFGVFLIDAANSAQLVAKLKKFAVENNVTLRYETIKLDIRKRHEQARKKYHFFRPFHTELPLADHLRAALEARRKGDK